MLDRLGRLFDPPENKVARALDGSNPLAPSAPLVPLDQPSILQEQHVGSHGWQIRKLITENQQFEQKIARATARQRLNVQRMIAAGSSGFGPVKFDADGSESVVTDPDELARMFPGVKFSTENPHEANDRKLVGEPAEVDYQPRVKSPIKHEPERMSAEEKARRDAKLPTEVNIRFTQDDLQARRGTEILNYAYERLADAGADMTIGTWSLSQDAVLGFVATWKACP